MSNVVLLPVRPAAPKTLRTDDLDRRWVALRFCAEEVALVDAIAESLGIGRRDAVGRLFRLGLKTWTPRNDPPWVSATSHANSATTMETPHE